MTPSKISIVNTVSPSRGIDFTVSCFTTVLTDGEVLTPLTSINTFDFSTYTLGGKVKTRDADDGIALVVFSVILSIAGSPN